MPRASPKTGPRRAPPLYLATQERLKRPRAAVGMKMAPINARSPNAVAAAIVKGLEAGFFHYLTKPIQARPLMEALDYALEFAALERSERTGVPSPSKTP